MFQQKSAACVGFAVASDIEFELIKQGLLLPNEQVSPWVTYGTFRYREAGAEVPSCLEIENESAQMASGNWHLHDGIYDIGASVAKLNSSPLCLIRRNESSVSQSSSVRVLNVEEYGRRGENISYNLLRALVDSNMPPILLINSDARVESEDWLNITRNGQYAHVLIVVGYGATGAVNPFTLKDEPYLIVRDSLG